VTETIGFKFGRVYLIQKQVVKNLRIIRNDFIIQQQIKDNQYNYLQRLPTIPVDNNLFSTQRNASASPASTKLKSNFLTWHSRTHFLNLNHLRNLVENNLVKGMNLRLTDFDHRLSFRPHCTIGKIRRKFYKK
jgi:hypothetical protein